MHTLNLKRGKEFYEEKRKKKISHRTPIHTHTHMGERGAARR
jgi:hypothetical protein